MNKNIFKRSVIFCTNRQVWLQGGYIAYSMLGEHNKVEQKSSEGKNEGKKEVDISKVQIPEDIEKRNHGERVIQ